MRGGGGDFRPEDLERNLSSQAADFERACGLFWHRLRSRFALDAIEAHAARPPAVLDVGAGAGVFGAHFRERFPDGSYAFVEPIAPLRETLRARYNADADWTDRRGGDVDAVVMLDVLEHQDDDAAFLAGWGSTIRPGTLLVVTVPAMRWLWSAWDERHGHRRRYEADSLRGALVRAGFRVLSARYLFQSLVLPGLFRRWRPPAGPEMPELPAFLNSLLLLAGRVERATVGGLPFGTTLACAAVREGGRKSP